MASASQELWPRVTLNRPFTAWSPAEIHQSIGQRFERQVDLYPERIAVKTAKSEISYSALNEAANKIARIVLQVVGAEEQPIALLLEKDVALMAAILGVLKAGKICVPLDPSFPDARAALILEDTEAPLLLTDTSNQATANRLWADEGQVVNVDAIGAAVETANLEGMVAPETLATLVYTSGSTGRPKGVLHTHQNLLRHVRGHTNELHVNADDRIALLASCSVGQGLKTVFNTLLNGATLYPYDVQTEGVEELAGWLRQEEITFYTSAVTVFRHFVRTLSEGDEFPQLRLLRIGNEPVRKADVEWYKKHFGQHSILVTSLSTTETGNFCLGLLDPDTPIQDDIVPVGYPVEDMEVLILDDADEVVVDGTIGEIAVRSAYLSPGYWRRPELNQMAFALMQEGQQPVYRTGDLGRRRDDGCIEHHGRKDFQVKVRGYRVELGEVEARLSQHPDVQDAVVEARDDEFGDKYLVAYIVPEPGRSPGIQQLRHEIKAELPAPMVPTQWLLLEALPITPNGKVDRAALRVLALEPDTSHNGSESQEVPEAGSSEQQQLTSQLIEVWERLFRVKGIRASDNFYELGGHSLLAMRLFREIKQLTGRNLPLATLVEAPTIEGVVARIYQRDWTPPWSPLVPLKPSGSKPPLYCIHAREGNVIGYNDLAQQLGPDQPVYGLQAQTLDGSVPQYNSIEELAIIYIHEIRTVQPKGPYFLCGLSFGGVLAIAMALQFEAQGEKVALVAMFDSFGPNIRARKFLARIAAHIEALWQLRPGERLALLRERGHKRVGVIKGAIRRSIHNRSIRKKKPPVPVDEGNQPRLALTGQEIYAGPVVLYLAQTRTVGPYYEEASMGWGGVLSDLRVLEVPGNHDSIIQSPNVSVLAAHLSAAMDEALQQGANPSS